MRPHEMPCIHVPAPRPPRCCSRVCPRLVVAVSNVFFFPARYAFHHALGLKTGGGTAVVLPPLRARGRGNPIPFLALDRRLGSFFIFVF